MSESGNPFLTGMGNGLVYGQQVFQCDQCRSVQFLRIANTEYPLGDATAVSRVAEAGGGTWFPTAATGHTYDHVPLHIADAADEVHRCFSIGAYRATASMARAVVESTAKEKGITSGSISAKIEELYKQNHIREHIRDAAHEIRYLGNEAAHGDFVDPITIEEAEELLNLMAEVLQEVFQSPARVAQRKAAREAKKAAQAGGS